MTEVARVIDMRMRPPVGGFLKLKLFDPKNGLETRLRQRGYEPPASFTERSVDLLFREMAAAAIDAAMVVARPAGRLGGVTNVEAAEVVRAHPQRFAGFVGALSIRPAEAEGELAECVELGAVGVALEPAAADPPLFADAQELLPVYELISAAELPVFVTGGDSGPDTSYGSPLHLERVSAAFPRLAFVAVHGGWPYVREMVAVALRRPNVWVMPDMYAARFPGHGEYIEAANGMLRDKMLFGTSYPAVNIEQLVASLHMGGLRAAAWQQMAIENPRRLLERRLM